MRATAWLFAGGMVCLALASPSAAQSLAQEPKEAAAGASNRDRLDAWRRSIDQRAALLSAPSWQAWIEPTAGETPCFTVHHVRIEADGVLPSRLAGLTDNLGDFQDACLGVRSIEALRTNLEARLTAWGYVTSSLTVPPQDLSGRQLWLALHLGRLAQWRVEWPAGAAPQQASPADQPAPNAVRLQAGNVLNLRDIEQALENLGRLPSQAAGFRIEPGVQPGTSVVVIVPSGGARWRGNLATETTDTTDYGPLQTTASLSWDAPLGWSDQLSLMVSLGQRAAGGTRARQSTALLNYSLPWGAHLFSAQWSGTAHQRPIQGGVSTFIEQGSDMQAQLRWQWTAWRSGSARLAAWASASKRLSRTLLEDTELLLRRRDSVSLDAGITVWQRHGCGDQSLEVEAGKVMRLARDAIFQSVPSQLPNTWRAQWQWDCSLGRPAAEKGAGAWQINGRLWAQGVRHPTGSIDLVSIGSRWTVRGQDPQDTLSGQGAWVARHELTSPVQALGPQGAARWFAGIDHGRIRQALGTGQTHQQLTGLATGLRWAWARASGELTAARAVGPRPADTGGARSTRNTRNTHWQASAAVQF